MSRGKWNVTNNGEQIIFRIDGQEYLLNGTTTENVVDKLEKNLEELKQMI